jgi:hypothetical protein
VRSPAVPIEPTIDVEFQGALLAGEDRDIGVSHIERHVA